MTKRLYYRDAILREFTARIQARQQTERGPAVRLDQTAFYPSSGGQPHDTGTLDGIPVLDVWETEDGLVWHLLERALQAEEVKGEIDWSRRFDHMQQHTGQHLLSAAFVYQLDAQTVGFHLGHDVTTIDLDKAGLTWEQAFQVEDQVNEVIWQNRPVGVHFVSPQEIGKIPLRKPPQVSGTIRVIWIEGYDASACGGTHCKTTGEVGLVKIIRLESYKGGTRVAFLCGERALRDYRRAQQILLGTSAELSVGQDELQEAVTRLQGELKDTRKAFNKTQAELIAYQAERLWDSVPEVNGVRRILAHWRERSFAEARMFASLLRQRPHTLLLLAVSEDDSLRLVCACSDDLTGLDAAAILQSAADSLGGRGGGSPTMAQGGAPLRPHDAVLAALEEAVRE